MPLAATLFFVACCLSHSVVCFLPNMEETSACQSRAEFITRWSDREVYLADFGWCSVHTGNTSCVSGQNTALCELRAQSTFCFVWRKL
jgi:hypothetical protein